MTWNGLTSIEVGGCRAPPRSVLLVGFSIQVIHSCRQLYSHQDTSQAKDGRFVMRRRINICDPTRKKTSEWVVEYRTTYNNEV